MARKIAKVVERMAGTKGSLSGLREIAEVIAGSGIDVWETDLFDTGGSWEVPGREGLTESENDNAEKLHAWRFRAASDGKTLGWVPTHRRSCAARKVQAARDFVVR
jgi:hypothetical protein